MESKKTLLFEGFSDDVYEQRRIEVSEELTVPVYIECRQPDGGLVHVSDDLTVRRYLGDRRKPVTLTSSHDSFALSRESRPDIWLGERVDETTIRERLHHVDSSAINPHDEGKSGDMRREILE